MPDIGKVSVKFEGDEKDLLKSTQKVGAALTKQSKQLERIQKEQRRTRASTSRLAGSFKKLAGTVLVAFGARGIGRLITSHIALADNTIKTARATGLSTRAFQELKFAADLGGISAESFASGMIAFSKRVGEAKVETGTMTTILKRMDEELFRSIQASTQVDQAFDLIINKAISLQNPLERTALLAAAFGRTVGPQMANFLLQGTAGIEDARKRARELGIVLSDDMLKAAEPLQDQITELGLALKTMITKAVLDNADALKTIFEGLLKLLPAVASGVSGVTKAVASIGNIGSGRQVSGMVGFGGVREMVREQRTDSTQEMVDRAKGAWQGWKVTATTSVKAVTTEVKGLNQALRQQARTLIGRMKGEEAGAQASRASYATALRQQAFGFIGRMKDESGQVKAEAGARRVRNEMEAFKSAQDQAARASWNVSYAFGRFIEDATDGVGRLRDAIGSLLSDLADLARRLLIVEPLERAARGYLQGAGIFGPASQASGAGGGGIGVVGGVIEAAAAGPGPAGKVARGGDTNINFNVTGSDEMAVRRAISEAMPSIEAGVSSRVSQDTMYPSVVRSGLRAGRRYAS